MFYLHILQLSDVSFAFTYLKQFTGIYVKHLWQNPLLFIYKYIALSSLCKKKKFM